ncbi:holo-[acyl-carrier protein] synthase [Rhizobium aethiopicum]|uniref:Holo-[acyl-carrier protein] synthase n=2 Tax=Rhizobium/Agrobacterium group TaxID=227290 RepID=A0A1C3Y3Q7_9HYPH|nr:holo-[acyl-carrier protein] synthase [Rhizobium aethiopicum]
MAGKAGENRPGSDFEASGTARTGGAAKFELTVFDDEATVDTEQGRRNTMDEQDRWRQMASAPRDGSRILVTIRASEQGPAEVDLAYWSHGDQFGGEGWRASDSSPGHIIEYAEPELKCWMPMPSANRTSMPSPWEGEDDEQLDGSGI